MIEITDHAPSIPEVQGLPWGTCINWPINQPMRLTIKSEDIDGDDVFYEVNWRSQHPDPCYETYGPFPEDTWKVVSFLYYWAGIYDTFYISIRAIDENGDASLWSNDPNAYGQDGYIQIILKQPVGQIPLKVPTKQ
jgi:hypothetical protein